MELREFVAETLKQVIEGVATAQEYAGAHGSVVGYYEEITNLDPAPQVVEFDVAITTADETQVKGGAGIMVAMLALGSQAQTDRANQMVSRIRFAVPLYLPVQKPGNRPGR